VFFASELAHSESGNRRHRKLATFLLLLTSDCTHVAAQLLDIIEGSSTQTKEPPPIREAAFASLKAPLRPVRAPVDPTDASEGA
jgi:hypothetical protein